MAAIVSEWICVQKKRQGTDWRRWFQRFDGLHCLLRRVAAGDAPAIEETKGSLEFLRERGASAHAFYNGTLGRRLVFALLAHVLPALHLQVVVLFDFVQLARITLRLNVPVLQTFFQLRCGWNR